MTENSEVNSEYPPADIRPLVAAPRGHRSVWLFAGTALLGGALLFSVLDARRETLSAPTISPVDGSSAGVAQSAPELFVPPPPLLGRERGAPWIVQPSQAVRLAQAEPTAAEPVTGRAARRRQANIPAPIYSAPVYAPPPPIPPQPIYDASIARPAPVDPLNQADRVRATQFANPETTVPKGTIIAAVLETALDSTRAGFARAIISRDVFSFDGSRVLIPRGSRLVGEYKSDFAPGQKRAQVQWQRLMRPDGAFINLDSPASDPLGRAGVGGKVDTHFFERFGGAILQSVLSIGTQVVAGKISNGGVILSVPGALQGTPVAPSERVQPTLKVRQGTSVSVFVAKDLDFSSVER